jgi:hypothetical protein
LIYMSKFWQRRAAERLDNSLDASTGIASFTDAEIAYAIKNYVEPDCSQTDPVNESDMGDADGARESILDAIDRFTAENGNGRHLLVVADAGMGKTALCLNFYRREQRKKSNKRKSVAVIQLGRPDAVEQIKAIERKRDTVLFLDGLDEDASAIRDRNARMQMLMEAAADFMTVIVTCRPQFFPEDRSISAANGVVHAEPVRRDLGTDKFHALYLLPFSEHQISAYIRSHFSLLKIRQRGQATQMIRDIPEIGTQPMLLALVPDLLREAKPVRELFDLYAFMVDSWLKRESKWIAPDKLLAMSKELAVMIYLNRDAPPHGERMSISELRDISADISEQVQDLNLGPRSLLDRDGEGQYKFAHRSIVEYLFVCAFIDGDDRCSLVEWTDLMRVLFLSWIRSEAGIAAGNRARSVLSQDLRKTHLLPLSDSVRGPKQVLRHELNKQRTGNYQLEGNGRFIPLGWRAGGLRMIEEDGLVNVFDFAYGLTWQITQTHHIHAPEERLIYRHSLKDVRTKFDAVSSIGDTGTFSDIASYRLPSIDEFISLWEAESTFENRQIFDRREFYWLGDRLEKSKWLVCSIGSAPVSDELLTLVVQRRLAGSPVQETFFVYEVSQRPRSVHIGQFFAAQVGLVQVGDAQANWYQHAAGDFAKNDTGAAVKFPKWK